MDKASEAVLALKPVTFRDKKDLDTEGIPQFGLVAEDVAKVDPELVIRDDQGRPYTVRYEAVNAMLLNEFLKEHRKVAAQGNQITELKTKVAKLEAEREEIAELKRTLASQAKTLQKVNARLTASEPATRLVGNP